jgi:hypothetical protein
MPAELRVPAQIKEQTYRRLGKLLDRLLTEACLDTARSAVRSEGAEGLASALHAFWSTGAAELNQSRDAATAFSEVMSYANDKKISSMLSAQ